MTTAINLVRSTPNTIPPHTHIFYSPYPPSVLPPITSPRSPPPSTSPLLPLLASSIPASLFPSQSKAESGSVPDVTRELKYSDEDDIVAIISDEHRAAEQLFGAFTESKDPDDRQIVLYNIVKLLSLHAACEELTVYPAFKDRIPGGEKIYRRAVQEQTQLKEDLKKADGMTWKDAGLEELVRKIIKEQTEHAREEEKEVTAPHASAHVALPWPPLALSAALSAVRCCQNLPLLAQHLSREELKALARDFQAAKKTAPTRYTTVATPPPFRSPGLTTISLSCSAHSPLASAAAVRC